MGSDVAGRERGGRTRAIGRVRAGWIIGAAIAGPPVLVGALLLGTSPTSDGAEVKTGDLWVGAGGYGPVSSADPDDIQDAHEALHALAAACELDTPEEAAVLAAVNRIVRFALVNPVGRFPIDDETATAESLLVVTERAVVDCVPRAAHRLRAALAKVR